MDIIKDNLLTKMSDEMMVFDGESHLNLHYFYKML